MMEHASGAYIRRYPPLGTSLFHDMGRLQDPASIHTVFDVGANVGQSALDFAQAFPTARIHCFEPVLETFKILARSAVGPRFHHNHLALGSAPGVLQMEVNDDPAFSDMNSLTGRHPLAGANDYHTEKVKIVTLDEHRSTMGLRRIDFLKIDTEGFDMEVLRGAARTLTEKNIGWIFVEISMSNANGFHVPLADVVAFLEPHGHHLFALYDQAQEHEQSSPRLRRANALFMPSDPHAFR